MGSVWSTFHDAAPPPDLLTGRRGGSSISHASRYATWLAEKMQAFGYPTDHGRSSPDVSMWDRIIANAFPAWAGHATAIRTCAVIACAEHLKSRHPPA